MYVLASVGDNTGAVDIVGPSNALYVDVAGSDALGQRGNAAQPFLTMAAALALAQSGDEVLISPGTFTGPVTLPAVANLIIRGSGQGSAGVGGTLLTAAGGVDVVTLNAANRSVQLYDVAITGVGAGKPLVGTGAAAGTAWLGSGLLVQNARLQAAAAGTLAVDLTYANFVTFLDSEISQGSMSFVTCAGTTFRGTRQSGTTCLFTWDNTDALRPAAGVNLVQLLEASSLVSVVSFTGQTNFQGDYSAVVSSMTGLNLSVAAGPVSPSFVYRGSVGTIDFGSAAAKILPDSALGAITVDFGGCTVLGASAEFESIATDQIVNMTGFKSTAATFALTAGVRALVIAIGAQIRTTAVTTMYATPDATGSITPPYLKGLTDIAAGGALVKTWANLGYTGLVRVGSAVFTATVTSNIQGADAVVPIAGKVATSLTITSTAQAGNTAVNVDVQF